MEHGAEGVFRHHVRRHAGGVGNGHPPGVPAAQMIRARPTNRDPAQRVTVQHRLAREIWSACKPDRKNDLGRVVFYHLRQGGITVAGQYRQVRMRRLHDLMRGRGSIRVQ